MNQTILLYKEINRCYVCVDGSQQSSALVEKREKQPRRFSRLKTSVLFEDDSSEGIQVCIVTAEHSTHVTF